MGSWLKTRICVSSFPNKLTWLLTEDWPHLFSGLRAQSQGCLFCIICPAFAFLADCRGRHSDQGGGKCKDSNWTDLSRVYWASNACVPLDLDDNLLGVGPLFRLVVYLSPCARTCSIYYWLYIASIRRIDRPPNATTPDAIPFGLQDD